MAKKKVHELAKELNVTSKDIIAYLSDHGVEVKSHMSTLEEDALKLVGRKYKEQEKHNPINVDKEKAKEAQTNLKEEKENVVVKEETNQTDASQADANQAVKKKKTIIVVSNPQNSKIQGKGTTQQPTNHNNSANHSQSGAQNYKKPQQTNQSNQQTIHRPLIKPTTKPLTPQDFENMKPITVHVDDHVKVNESQAPVVKNDVVTETSVKVEDKPVERPTLSTTSNQGSYQNRPQGDRPQGTYQNRPQGDRPQGTYQNRPQGTYQNRPQGDRPQGSYQNRPQGSYQNRPQGDRPQGGYNNSYNKDGRGAAGQRPNKPFAPESPIKENEKHRDEEKRRINQTQDRDKRSKKDKIYEEDSNKLANTSKVGRFIKPEKKVMTAEEEKIKVITIPDIITIKELAEAMKLQPSAIVKKLFLQGQIVTVNQEVAFETAEEIAIEYEIMCEREIKVDVIEELLKEDKEQDHVLMNRPPVICVMGHVDHGKTSLLDAIRKTNVTDREAGGITQHIGAYMVSINGQSITFLDTPGHEAFTSMRMRGANATDIAILVVAADDGVMPQTVEAINHAKAAGIEIIVAVNKIDKPSANMDRVKQELTEHGLIAEDWGGSTVFAPVSAKTGEGIEHLLEMIILSAELLELKANPDRKARGIVIEAELDKGRGPVATVLVQKGTLRVGDFVSAGVAHGKVRAMVDDKGRRVKEAGPSRPVEILGLSDVPNAGDILISHENDKSAKTFAETFVSQNKEKKIEETKSKMSLDDLFTQIQAGNLKELNLIIKADVQGSVEAVKQSLAKLSNEEVVVKCIHGGVGAVNESDVILALASKAIIIGFNVRPDATAKATAEREGVDLRLYKVIYQAIEDVEAAMKGMLDPIFEERVIGHAEVRQIFKASNIGNIAGSFVLDGKFERGCKVRIHREGKLIFEGKLESLKRFKDDVKEVKAGYECGLVFDDYDQMQELDVVEAYIMVEVPR